QVERLVDVVEQRVAADLIVDQGEVRDRCAYGNVGDHHLVGLRGPVGGDGFLGDRQRHAARHGVAAGGDLIDVGVSGDELRRAGPRHQGKVHPDPIEGGGDEFVPRDVV